MNPDGRVKSNSNRAAKAISGLPIAGIVVAASLLLLSGLSTIGSYHSVLAQQAMPQGGGINANITAGGGGNATTTNGGAAGGNQSEARMQLEEVRTALQNNDTQGALMHLDIAINLLGSGGGAQGNMTSTPGFNK